MKYVSYGIIGLSTLCFFILKPWPQMQLSTLAIWGYSFLFIILFRLKKAELKKLPPQVLSDLAWAWGFGGGIFIGGTYATAIVPWLKRSIEKSELIHPIPILAITSIILAPPIICLCTRIAQSALSKKR